MKIAFMISDKAGYDYTMSGIASGLVDLGHDVMSVYPGEPPEDRRVAHGNCNYELTDLDSLVSFKPNSLVYFNGYHPHMHAARVLLRDWLQNTKKYYMEHAWLPQREYDYLYEGGFGSGYFDLDDHEYLDKHYDLCLDRVDHLEHIRRTYYTPKQHNLNLPKDYILVPLQLENDTSIIYGSPVFKNMRSLVGYVIQNFSDHPIVVKRHPMVKHHPREVEPHIADLHVIEVDANTPIIDLMPASRAVVGINSTSLIESLMFKKPVLSLGKSVLSGKGVFHQDVFNPREVLSGVPDNNYGRIDKALSYLLDIQHPRNKLTDRVIRLLTS